MELPQGIGTSFSLFKHQVSGKAPKLATPDNKLILKCYLPQEDHFYSHFAHHVHASLPEHALLKFLPAFHGVLTLNDKPDIKYESEGDNKEMATWLKHVKVRYEKKNQGHSFLLLSNFLFGFARPNILDIKIGGRSEKPQKVTKSVAEYRIKLNGMLKTNEKNETQFVSKYLINSIASYKDLQRHIAFFFNQSGKLQVLQVQSILSQLQQLVLALRATTTWRFTSTSICLFYDLDCPNTARVKFIDFGRAIRNELLDSYDWETSAGVESVVQMMKQIAELPERFQEMVIETNGEVVPDSKVKKFQSQDRNQTEQK